MLTKNEIERHLQRCRQHIEQQLNWGPSEQWTTYDFSKLGELVHSRTQVRLSVSTLKRIWGRLKYDNAPTSTTMNALAQFAGYADWRTFCQEGAEQKDNEREDILMETPLPGKSVRNHYWWLAIVPLLAVTGWLVIPRKGPGPDPSKFAFEANKIKTEGVPNSVIFRYDASAALTDSVFIVQTWDIRRKKLVPKERHEHSAIYYYPGFFSTKLIADGEIVKHHDLWITSDGWLGLVEAEPVPIYFNKNEYEFKDRVEVNEALLAKYNLPLQPTPPKVRFFNQRDLGNIMSDNFVFETTLKNDHSTGSGACQYVQVLIQCKNDIIIIPLADKSCVGNLEFWFCGTGAVSADTDLSGFGCNLNEWTTLRVETVNKRADIYVNGNKAHSVTFPNEATGVVGVQYRFFGPGAVKESWFEADGKRISNF